MNLLQKPWRHDAYSNLFKDKHFKHLPRFGGLNAPIETLPETLGRPRNTPFNQGETQECAANSAAKDGELIYGLAMSVPYQVDKISRIQGAPVDVAGSDPNAAMKAQMYEERGGFCLISEYQKGMDGTNDLHAMARGQKAYLKPSGGKDMFDSMKLALYNNYNFDTKLGAGIRFFIPWYESFNQTLITEISGKLLGYHSIEGDDFMHYSGAETIRSENSYGQQYDGGYQYWTRDVINQLFSQWGSSAKYVVYLTDAERASAQQNTQIGHLWLMFLQLYYNVALYVIQLYGKLA